MSKKTNTTSNNKRPRSNSNLSTISNESSISSDNMETLLKKFSEIEAKIEAKIEESNTNMLSNINHKIEESSKVLQSSIEVIKSTLNSQSVQISNLKTEMQLLSSTNGATVKKVSSLEKSHESLERECNKINLIIDGILEIQGETAETLISHLEVFFATITPAKIEIDTAFRLGQTPNPTKPRQVKVRFARMRDRNIIYDLRMNAKPPHYINEDLPKTIRVDFGILRRKAKQLKDEGTEHKILWNQRSIQTATSTFTVKEGVIQLSPFLGNNPSGSNNQ